MNERQRWTIWVCPGCGAGGQTRLRHLSGCSGPSVRHEVVPAPGPGTGLYQLTDEQVRMTIGWLQVARDVALARGVDPVIAVLRAGLDDSDGVSEIDWEQCPCGCAIPMSDPSYENTHRRLDDSEKEG